MGTVDIVTAAWVVLLACICLAAFGNPADLPEAIEITNENTSVCYGTHTHFRPTCAHQPGTVIGVQAIKVGAKRSSLDCPSSVHDNDRRNDTCCSPNTTQDCIHIYDYKDSGIDYKFHKYCSGYSECIQASQAVNDHSKCVTNMTDGHLNFTNYMFMEFACIPVTRVGKLCSNETYQTSETGSPFYLQSPSYPKSMTSTNIEMCTCHVQATSGVRVYILDLRLNGQTLTISDSDTSDIYDQINATIFNVTLTNKTNESWITLDSTSNNKYSYVWIGLEAMDSNPFSVICTVFGENVGTVPVYSTKTVPKIGETKSRVMLEYCFYMYTKPTEDTKDAVGTCIDPDLGMIAGIAVGLLFLLILIVSLICCLWKNKKRKLKEKKKKVGKDHSREMTATLNPMNEKFKPSKLPSNKVEPTRYIEEHGALRTTQLPPLAKAPNAVQGQENMYVPAKLPPLNTLTFDAKSDEHENTIKEHKRNKERKKHKRHKHKEKTETEMEVKSESEIVKAENNNLEQVREESKRSKRKKTKKRKQRTNDPENGDVVNETNESII